MRLHVHRYVALMYLVYRQARYQNDRVDHKEHVLNLFYVDVDECASGAHNCSNNATCTDTDDSYSCTCKSGYDGDGFNCTSM